MTNLWIVTHIPGYIASLLTRLPEASSVPAYRRMVRYTDDTLEVIDNPTGTHNSYSIHINTTTECTLTSPHGKEYSCCIRSFDTTHTRTTHGSVSSINTTYWNIHTEDGILQVHKSMHDETQGSTEWTLEMWGDVPDADTLTQIVHKYISS